MKRLHWLGVNVINFLILQSLWLIVLLSIISYWAFIFSPIYHDQYCYENKAKNEGIWSRSLKTQCIFCFKSSFTFNIQQPLKVVITKGTLFKVRHEVFVAFGREFWQVRTNYKRLCPIPHENNRVSLSSSPANNMPISCYFLCCWFQKLNYLTNCITKWLHHKQTKKKNLIFHSIGTWVLKPL